MGAGPRLRTGRRRYVVDSRGRGSVESAPDTGQQVNEQQDTHQVPTPSLWPIGFAVGALLGGVAGAAAGLDQAVARQTDKGVDAAQVVVEMANLLDAI